MAVTAETDSFYTVWFSISIRMASVTNRPLGIVPYPVLILHKSGLVCLWICSLNAIVIKMTFNTRRVSSFYIMAGLACFNIFSRELRVQSAACINAQRSKVRLQVALR